MSTHVIVELRQPTGAWRLTGTLLRSQATGSISSEDPAGRQVYLFGWVGGAGPAIWRSVGGLDEANRVARAITTLGVEKIADLSDGPHELDWWRNGRPFRLRFSAR